MMITKDLILRWLRKIVDFLILNRTLLKAYLTNYKGETFQSLASKIAKQFIKQNAQDLVTDYLATKFESSTSKIKGVFTSAWDSCCSYVGNLLKQKKDIVTYA